MASKQYTISSSSFTVGSAKVKFYYILNVTENSVNVENNTSLLTIKATLRTTLVRGSSINLPAQYFNFGCTINGRTIFSKSKQVGITKVGQIELLTYQTTLIHNDDGNLSITVGGTIKSANFDGRYFPSGGLAITESSSTAMHLTQIDRGGFMWVNIDGTWKKGTPYVNVNGTWKKGVPYFNNNGTWTKGK